MVDPLSSQTILVGPFFPSWARASLLFLVHHADLATPWCLLPGLSLTGTMSSIFNSQKDYRV